MSRIGSGLGRESRLGRVPNRWHRVGEPRERGTLALQGAERSDGAGALCVVLESCDSVLGYVSQDRIAVQGRLTRVPKTGLRDGMGLIAAQVTSVHIPRSPLASPRCKRIWAGVRKTQWTAGFCATDQLSHLFSTLLTLPHFDR